MQTPVAQAMPDGWSISERSNGFRSHWHQPLLPHDYVQPTTVLAAALGQICRRLIGMGRLIANAIRLWVERDRSRRELAELSDHVLRDVGLTRADVWSEASKPFWQA